MRELIISEDDAQVSLSILNVYSTVIMKINSLNILFDPIAINPDKYNNDIDFVVVTHEHIDHFDKKIVAKIHDQTDAVILTTPFVFHRLADLERVVPLRPGDSYESKGVSFCAEPCVHEANDPITFLIKTDEGALFHPADSDYFPELEDIRKKYRPEIMIYTGCSERNLRKIASAICPSIIVSNAYPMLREFSVEGSTVKSLRQSEWFSYTFTGR